MFFCPRNETDPLLELLLKKHHLHLLRWPRKGIIPGDIVIEKGGGRTLRAPSDAIFKASLSGAAVAPEDLADIEETFSNKLDAKIGVRLLDHITALFGGGKGSFDSAYDRAAKVSIRVAIAQWLACDPARLSEFVVHAELRQDQGLFNEGDRLYIVSGVAMAEAVEVMAYDNNGVAVTAEADLVTSGVEASAGVTARREGTASTVYKASEPIVLGVELLELVGGDGGWQIKSSESFVQVRGGAHARVPVEAIAVIGDPVDGPAFFDFPDA